MLSRTSSLLAPSSTLLLPSVLCLFLAGAAAGEVVVEVDYGATEPVRLGPSAVPRQLTDGPGILLPFFRVDSDGTGETSLFAVRNNGVFPLPVTLSYFEGQGGNVARVEDFSLGPHAVKTINLRNVPGLPFAQGERTGFLVAEAPATAGPAAILSGDYFRVDPSDAAAGGGTMIDAELAECRRWSHRFLNGGAFDGGTNISFLALDVPDDGPTVWGNVYDEAGELVAVASVTSDRVAFEIGSADLGLPIPFGSIDWVFAGNGHGTVVSTFTANNLFSVGAEARCVEEVESEDPGDGSTVFRLPGTFLTCNGCGNWQYDMPFGEPRLFSKVTVEFNVYVAGWDPAKPGGFHCLFWLNNGSRWQDMMGYLNSRGVQSRMVFQSNGPLGSPIGVEQYRSPGLQTGKNYRIHYEYDTVEEVVWYSVRDLSTGEIRVADTIVLPPGMAPVTTSYTFIQFGSQPSSTGPEALTEGWRFSDFEARFIP